MKRMRDGNYNINELEKKPRKDLTMRDMLKITRSKSTLNEDVNDERKTATNKKTVFDQSTEEQKMINFFKDLNVNIKFIDLEIYDNLVFFGGTIAGVIKFVFTVTPDETTSHVEFDYTDDFSPDNPENDEIIKRVEMYYDNFSKYWRNNMIQQ